MAEKNSEGTDPQQSENDTAAAQQAAAQQLLRDVASIKQSLDQHDQTTNDRIEEQTKKIAGFLGLLATLLVAVGLGGYSALSSSIDTQAVITSAEFQRVRNSMGSQIRELRTDAQKDNRELRSAISRLAAEIHGLALAVERLSTSGVGPTKPAKPDDPDG